MKLTRLVSMILAILLLLTMPGCQKAPVEEAALPSDTEEQNVESPNSTDKADVPPVTSQRDAFASTPEEFTAKLQNMVDLSKYEVEQDSDYPNDISYDLDTEYDYSSELDYTISFGDGSSITIPLSFASMENTGWTTEAPADYLVSNFVQRGIPYINANGEEITLWTTNLADIDKDEEASCPLSECTFYSITFDLYTEESKENEDGEYVDFYQANPNAPHFTIAGSVTESSSIEDVIKTIGLPSTISFEGDSNEIKIDFIVEENDWYGHLMFWFAADSDYIVSVSYDYPI